METSFAWPDLYTPGTYQCTDYMCRLLKGLVTLNTITHSAQMLIIILKTSRCMHIHVK